jgi:uncharacterized protein YjbJ (UPF0337 family)
MSIENRAKAAAEKTEGAGQELVGKVTGNTEDKVAGKAKQNMGKVRDGIEDAKDSIVDAARKVSDKVHDAVEEGKDKLNRKG